MTCSWLCWLECIPRTHCSELAATEFWSFRILLPSWSLQYLKGIPAHLTCICNEYIAERVRGTEHAKMLAFKHLSIHCCCCCLVAKLCPTLCDPRDCSPPGSSVHGILWDPPGKNTGVGSHSLLQGVFRIQGLNPGLLHCRHTREALKQNVLHT